MSNSGTLQTPTITIGDLVKRLRNGIELIGLAAAAALVAALLFLIVVPPSYIATMTVAPPSQNGSGISQIGQTISALGLGGSLGDSSPITFQLYSNLLTSQAVAQNVENKHHVIRQIFSGRWDEASQRWRPASGPAAWSGAMLRSITGRPPRSNAPQIQDLIKYIQSKIRIDSPEVGSPLRIITFSAPDAQFAADMLLWLHQESDALVRISSLKRTNGMVAYLREQLPQVHNTDEHLALVQLLVTQEQNLTMLHSGADYSAMILDPPLKPVDPSPAILMTLMLSLAAGIGLGGLAAAALPGHLVNALKIRSWSGRLLRRDSWPRTINHQGP